MGPDQPAKKSVVFTLKCSSISWDFGRISREEANEILRDKHDGVFLVRHSKNLPGDLVLCVRESGRDGGVSHYIINKVVVNCSNKYKIGDQDFDSIPDLLNFYKNHYLESTPLISPAPKKFEKVVAMYDFSASSSDELSFRKGEVLEILTKDEEPGWWRARNSQGEDGLIPSTYVESCTRNILFPKSDEFQKSAVSVLLPPNVPASYLQRKLPAPARVTQARIPNAYDKTALRLEVGDIVTVTKTSANGTWEGELKGRGGHFPFTYVKFLDEDSLANSIASNGEGAELNPPNDQSDLSNRQSSDSSDICSNNNNNNSLSNRSSLDPGL